MGKRTGHSRPEERADERADRRVGGSEEPPTSRPDDAGSPLPAQQTPPGRPPNASPTPGKDQRRNRAV
jgi:hypothetical protein